MQIHGRKRWTAGLLAALLFLCALLPGCAATSARTLKIGTLKGVGEGLLRQVVAPALLQQGIQLQVKVFAHRELCVADLENEKMAAVLAQTVDEVSATVQRDNRVVEIARVYFSPLGLYGPANYKLTYLKDQDVVFAPDTPQGVGRTLLLLQQAGLLTLTATATPDSGMECVLDNPRNLTVQATPTDQLTALRKSGHVVALDAQQAQAAGLTLKNALVREREGAAARESQAYALTVLDQHLDDATSAALTAAITSDAAGQYIAANFSTDYLPSFDYQPLAQP